MGKIMDQDGLNYLLSLDQEVASIINEVFYIPTSMNKPLLTMDMYEIILKVIKVMRERENGKDNNQTESVS